jgi:hypothetical protein
MAISTVWKADSRSDQLRVANAVIRLVCMAALLTLPQWMNAQPKPAITMSAEEIFGKFASAVVYVECDISPNEGMQGSGVLASADGFVLTNAHVVTDCKKVTVTYINGQTKFAYDARLKYFDSRTDVAVIKVDAKGLEHFEVVRESGRIGERVYAIGNPEGLTQTISDGIFSGMRECYGVPCVQHSAPTSHGSSGGALISAEGRLLGINYLRHPVADAQNLNFAVPVATFAYALSLAQSTPHDLLFEKAEDGTLPRPEAKDDSPHQRPDALKEFLSRNYIGAMQISEQNIAAGGDKGGNYALIAASLYQLGRNSDAVLYLNQALALLTKDDAYRQTMLYYRLILLTDGTRQAPDLRTQIEQTASMFLASKNPVLGISDPEARQWVANILASLRAEDAARLGPLDNDAIVKMVAGGAPEDAVIRTIESRQGKYVLAPNAVLLLRRAGVPQGVMAAMSSKMSAQR